MRGICEECLRPIVADRCPEHPFTRPLRMDDPADREVLETLRGLRAARTKQGLVLAGLPSGVAVLTGLIAVVGEVGLLTGFVTALMVLLGAAVVLLPVLPVLWLLGLLGSDLVSAVRRRMGLHAPAAAVLLPGVPISDPIRAAENARAVRMAHRAARSTPSRGPRVLH